MSRFPRCPPRFPRFILALQIQGNRGRIATKQNQNDRRSARQPYSSMAADNRRPTTTLEPETRTMSLTAMHRNRNSRTTSGRDHCCGDQTGHGVPTDHCIYQTFRMFDGGRIIYPPEYGQMMTEAAAAQLDIDTGRASSYGRNVVSFVMSRRARRAGMTTDNHRYNRRAAIGRREPATA